MISAHCGNLLQTRGGFVVLFLISLFSLERILSLSLLFHKLSEMPWAGRNRSSLPSGLFTPALLSSHVLMWEPAFLPDARPLADTGPSAVPWLHCRLFSQRVVNKQALFTWCAWRRVRVLGICILTCVMLTSFKVSGLLVMGLRPGLPQECA